MSDRVGLDLAGQWLSDFGITMERLADVKGAAPAVRLSRGATHASYGVVQPQQSTLSAVLQHTSQLDGLSPLVLAGHLHPRTTAALRRANIQYIDASGNALLTFGDVYIHVEGKRRDRETKAPQGDFFAAPSNVFSPRRSQVIFALITWPELIAAPVRAVAKRAGTSVGIAQETIALLDRMDLEPHREPRTHDHLIDMWATSYPEGLGRKLALRSFSGEASLNELDLTGVDAWVSGEAFAPGISGQGTLTLYLDQFEPQLILRNRWRKSETPNIFLRRKFWDSTDEREDTRLSGPPAAPPLIVYADMLAQGDPRIRAAAAKFREGHGGLTVTRP